MKATFLLFFFAKKALVPDVSSFIKLTVGHQIVCNVVKSEDTDDDHHLGALVTCMFDFPFIV